MNHDERVDRPFLSNFFPHLLWPVLAVIVIAAIGLFVLTPWSDDVSDEGTTPAMPTPSLAGTPNP